MLQETQVCFYSDQDDVLMRRQVEVREKVKKKKSMGQIQTISPQILQYVCVIYFYM